MHLVHPLASGVVGAGNGRAEIYQGIDGASSSRALHYTNFKGAGGSVTNINLDGNGGAVRYVDQLVTVKVYSSTGSLIRTFTAGAAAPNVEVVSQSFTGKDYETPTLSGASYPTTLQALLDLWKTNAGNTSTSIDWKVSTGGVTKTLSNWMGEFSAMWFNVKDPAFGAKGDGTTDDQSAITAAIAAANAVGGGIVFFPPGTYRITTSINVTFGVSLLGSGPEASIITMDSASNSTLEILGHPVDSIAYQFVRGFGFQAMQTCTGRVAGWINAFVLFENCHFGTNNLQQGDLITEGGASTNGGTVVRDCTFKIRADGKAGIDLNYSDTPKYIENCTFIPPATFNHFYIRGSNMEVSGCRFDNAVATSGTFDAIRVRAGGNSFIRGCDFPATGGATCTAIKPNSLASGEILTETGNNFKADGANAVTPYDLSTGSDTQRVRLFSREMLQAELADNSATISVDSEQFGIVKVQVTSSGARTINLNSNIPLNSRFVLILHNDGSGGAIVFTIDGTDSRNNGTYSVNNNSKTVLTFVAVPGTSSSPIWHEASANENIAE